MKTNQVLIRYGELSTKGKNRKSFISHLRENIRQTLSDLSSFKIRAERDRMFIFCENEREMEEIIVRLPSVFGIQSFSPVIECGHEPEQLKVTAKEVISKLDTEGKSFKVTVKRPYKAYPLEKLEIMKEIGSHVLRNFPELHVQMQKPDIELKVEIREEAAYLMAEVIQGAGGLPVGAGGKALLMLSGGIDSPVAGYYMLKRGVRLELIHFFSPPYTNERAKEKVFDLAERLSRYGASIKLHIIPFTELQQQVHKQMPENITMTSTRRMMLRIAERVMKEVDAKAIINGESLGQVASQTIDSMHAINAVTSAPILRPLVAMDKLEIIDVAQKIDTYDISIRPYEDCCTIFTPANPKTKPKLEKVEHYESYLDFDSLIEECVAQREVIKFPRVDKKEFEDLL
ncbi:tRNA uracil 4-sulfurtransferase ThiI [Planomicrobium sp. YIM 101495]|uniref:tRNA uracil 4-sulfurtransferase ThiI n=1 Tax=Planomicrobium sp. YIM 101495 TaxID=2665160 RepID=UPI0012B9C10A|nr:tRNA uracil 4-sulfurtransferase ThiI [Planomicrobium sp. YIM 101495]MTD29562.1 tRNA 4-thiouridine(8) synthase ThiI [Planomicrobium sp. YIM 101495]